MIDHPRGPLSFRGGGHGAGWAIIIAILGAIICALMVAAIPGCGTLSPSQKPSQGVAPIVAPAVAGTGNTTTTTTDTTSNQHSEQTTAGTSVHGAVASFVQNTGMTILGLAMSLILGCWVIAAFFFGIVAKIEVQGVVANVVCWIGVGVFGIVLPLVVFAIATGRI